MLKLEDNDLELKIKWFNEVFREEHLRIRDFNSYQLELFNENMDFLRMCGTKIVKFLRDKFMKSILEQKLCLIEPEFIENLDPLVVKEIYWQNETRLLEKIIDLIHELKLKFYSYYIFRLMDIIGEECFEMLPKAFSLLEHEDEYFDDYNFGPKIFSLIKNEIFEFERGKDTLIFGNKKLSSYLQGVGLLSTINIMNDMEKEKIIQNREILRQMLILYNNKGFPNKTPFDFFNNNQLKQIPLRDIAFSFFMEKDIVGISSILTIWGFSFRKIIETLYLEDWRNIIENPNFNFIELITRAMLLELDSSNFPNNFTDKWLVEYMGQEVREKLREQIRIKIIDSFQQKNVQAILGIFSMDYHYYFTEEEIIKLIEYAFTACIKAQEIEKNDSLEFYIQRIKDLPKNGETELQRLSEPEKIIFRELKNSLLVSVNDIKIENGKIICLELNGRTLNELPKCIYQLTSLEEVNLSHNRLDSLPPSLGKLHSLRVIDLSWNNIVSLPESIGNLNSLNSLDLGYNNITAVPTSIGNITSLEELIIKNNKFRNIMEVINKLPKSLRILDLSDNNLTSIPETINRLQSLLSLDLSSNNLLSIPESIGDLNLLHSLDLSYNKINILPPSIGDLSSLKKINIGWNRIKNLPNTIGNLFNLKRLQINNNLLSSLPESIGNLISLEEILLSNNKISFLPKSIGNLSSLNYLSLQINKLSNLPKTICNISSLKFLLLRCNGLTRLPESLGNLQSLERLGLDTNKLETLPESVGHLSSLKDLTLFHNPLKSLPESIENLTSLKISLDSTQSSTLKDTFKELEKRGLNIKKY